MKSKSTAGVLMRADTIDENPISPITLKKLNITTGSFIRNKRLEQSLTGKQLGDALKVSQQQISRYELGITTLNLNQLDQIFMILSIPWECFFQEVISQLIDREIL